MLLLIHSKYSLHGLLRMRMDIADGIHAFRKLLCTVYSYVRFGIFQYSFQLQQYRVGREADTDMSLNTVAESVVYRAGGQPGQTC